MKRKKIISDENKKIIISEYLSGLGLKKIADKLKLYSGRIIEVLLENNIQLRTASQAHHKYNYQEDIFDQIDCHEKAYWLGFLMGDGNINAKHNVIQIALCSKDISHLYKFNLFANSNYLIKTHKRSCKFKKYYSNIEYSKLTISSPQWVKSLAKLNVIPNKTFKEKLPNINEIYYNSFILGFLDADGSWIKNKDRNNHRYIQFSLLGNKEFLTDIQNILVKNCEVNKNKIFVSNKNSLKPIYLLRYGGNIVAKNIAKFLYKDSPVWLDRKKEIVSHYLI